MIRILLVEDHMMVRKGLRSLLENETGIEVVDEAGNGREAIQKVESLKPDIVLMDISMPTLNGLDATRQIKRQHPDMKILILTMHTAEEYVFEVLDAGASGYVVKQSAPNELVTAIHAVSRGETYLSPKVSGIVVQEILNGVLKKKKEHRLTEREREIVQLIAEGHSNREIADTLHISIKTVDTHRSNLMEKLDLHSIADITRYAIRNKIINP